jgi:magnesium chelatase subunit D
VKFSQFIDQEDAKLGLILNAIDPSCGGIVLVGGKGSGKSTLARLARGIFQPDTPFVELPLNVTEESLLGGIDLEQTLSSGCRTLQPGIISRANNGVVFIDDINLLSHDLLALLMEPQGRGEEIIEREGLTERRESRFTILATMNPEEGDLSPHLLDRIGLCAVMEELQETRQRLAILTLAAQEPHFRTKPDAGLQERIAAARIRLPYVQLSAAAHEHLHAVVQQNISLGHRGDLFLYYAARAFTALEGCNEIAPEQIDRVANLVFAHRRLQIREEDQSSTEQEQQHDHEQQEQTQAEQPPPPESGQNDSNDQPQVEGEQQTDSSPHESSEREEVMQVGDSFKVRRISFRKDRQKRHASGRRTKTRVKGRGGRYVKSILSSTERDIALDATLRASAPYQKLRGREDRVLIEQDDLRFKQRERKMGHLVLFVVDGSGSMGAKQRMVETKGAIQSLLMDCYQKRDKVAMIVFRKDRAELVLPPTASVELAAKRLSVLPVGGKTPLAAGLLETHRLVKRVSLREPETRMVIVLITDGRGNQSLGETSTKDEVAQLARLLAEERGCDFIVIDTENKGNFLKVDKALALAKDLEADYYTIEALRAEYLSQVVQAKTLQ